MKHCCCCKTINESIKYLVVCQGKNPCYRCEPCHKAKQKATWDKNKHKYLAKNRSRGKAWYQSNRKKKLKNNKKWRTNNIEKVREYHRNYERIKRQDPIYRLHQSVSSAIRRCIYGKNERKWQSLVGYSTEDLKLHLERQFKEGMKWENYGEWHIDHIRPIASFSITSAKCKDFKECWALSNLQPLWAEDNIAKGAR